MKANPYQQLLPHVYSTAFLLFQAQISTVSAFAGQREQLNLHLWGTEEAMNEFSLSLEEGEVRPWIGSHNFPGPYFYHLSNGIIISTPLHTPHRPPSAGPCVKI